MWVRGGAPDISHRSLVSPHPSTVRSTSGGNPRRRARQLLASSAHSNILGIAAVRSLSDGLRAHVAAYYFRLTARQRRKIMKVGQLLFSTAAAVAVSGLLLLTPSPA